MKYIAILLTVYNRKAKTLQCLERLFLQKPVEGYTWDVFLTDDGCTDGTPEEVQKQFPTVTIIKGNGNLYWNRGMHLAWDTATKVKEYDYYLWLNDDTMLYENALQTVLNASLKTNEASIICGATCDETTNKVTYSGLLKGSDFMIVPNGSLQECHITNGNFLLVPKKVFNVLGNLDMTFRHAIGDFDYGLRAVKSGFKNYVTPTFVGICENNPTLPKWCLKTTPILKRIKLLYSPLGYAEPIPFFVYEKRHYGLFTAIKHFLTIHLRVLIPSLWKN